MYMYDAVKMDEVLWVAASLFARGFVHGCTGNISFKDQNHVYISKSGSCFGTLTADDFAIVDLDGKILKGKPSKEFPLHVSMYAIQPDCQFVIHTHSYYTTLLTCETTAFESTLCRLLKRTPYLSIKTNNCIGYIPYYAPGSKELFDAFDHIKEEKTNVYLMERHGLLVGGKTGIEAMDLIEEMEMSARLDHDVRRIQ